MVPRLKTSSVSFKVGNFTLFILDSPPSSPKRNAAFSRPTPEAGRLPDFKNGDGDFGGDDLSPGPDASGSNIQENEDCAILDLVGTGAFGRSTASTSDSGTLSVFREDVEGVTLSREDMVSSTVSSIVSDVGEGGICV